MSSLSAVVVSRQSISHLPQWFNWVHSMSTCTLFTQKWNSWTGWVLFSAPIRQQQANTGINWKWIKMAGKKKKIGLFCEVEEREKVFLIDQFNISLSDFKLNLDDAYLCDYSKWITPFPGSVQYKRTLIMRQFYDLIIGFIITINSHAF